MATLRRASLMDQPRARRASPISFAGSQLTAIRHVCAFFNSAEEEYGALLPFIRDGFDRGDKAVHVLDPRRHSEHLRRLGAASIDHASARERGQFELRTCVETYLRGGRFDQHRMVGEFEALAARNREEGFPASRIVCQMDWAVEAGVPPTELVEFESRVNQVWTRYDDAVICVYDLAKFSGETVIDIMRTHPAVIIGGTLQLNPFYVPPERFLRETRQRRTGQSPQLS
jgi:hypothetical protein